MDMELTSILLSPVRTDNKQKPHSTRTICPKEGAFTAEGWVALPPVGTSISSDFDLSNLFFLGVILGLIREGRAKIIYVTPPFSRFVSGLEIATDI